MILLGIARSVNTHSPSLSLVYHLPAPPSPHPLLPHSVYTMQLMLECKHYVVKRLQLPLEKRKSLNYTELGRQALGQVGKWAVDISVLGCNLGVCAGYMIFIAGNLFVSVMV